MKKAFIAIIFIISLPLTAGALDYTPLAPIPQLQDTSGKTTVESFIPGAIRLIVGISGALAVIFIMIGGIKYLSTDAWGGKSEAKDTIQNAIFGLLLVIGAYVILNTVNPNLVNLRLEIEGLDGGRALDGDLGGEENPDNPNVGCEGTANCDYDNPGDTPGDHTSWGPLSNGVTLVGIPLKDSCMQVAHYPCQVNSTAFESKIQRLKSITDNLAPKLHWWITEAWPPNWKHHTSHCHNPGWPNTGGCIDVNLHNQATLGFDGVTQRNPQNYALFVKAISDAGFTSFKLEVGTDNAGVPCKTTPNQCQAKALEIRDAINILTGASGLSSHVIINANATGDHIHINHP